MRVKIRSWRGSLELRGVGSFEAPSPNIGSRVRGGVIQIGWRAFGYVLVDEVIIFVPSAHAPFLQGMLLVSWIGVLTTMSQNK